MFWPGWFEGAWPKGAFVYRVRLPWTKKNMYRSNTTWEMQNADPPRFQILEVLEKSVVTWSFSRKTHPSFQHLKITTRRRNGIFGDATSCSCHAKANTIEVAPISSDLVVGILKLNNSGRKESMCENTRSKTQSLERSLSVFLLHLGDKVRGNAHGVCVCVCEVDQPAFVTSNWCLMMMPPSRHFWVDDFQLLPFEGIWWGYVIYQPEGHFLGSLLLHVHSFKLYSYPPFEQASRLNGSLVAIAALQGSPVGMP